MAMGRGARVGVQEAELKHGYVQLEAAGAAHVKGTFVRQAPRSRYELTEACLGADLARHDVAISQATAPPPSPPAHTLLHPLILFY